MPSRRSPLRLREAGPQMTAVLGSTAVLRADGRALGAGYDRTQSDAARAILVAAMAEDLKAIATGACSLWVAFTDGRYF